MKMFAGIQQKVISDAGFEFGVATAVWRYPKP